VTPRRAVTGESINQRGVQKAQWNRHDPRPIQRRRVGSGVVARTTGGRTLTTGARSLLIVHVWMELWLSLFDEYNGNISAVYSGKYLYYTLNNTENWLLSPVTSSASVSPLCSSIALSLFRLNTYLFTYSIPRSLTSSSRTASTDVCSHRFFRVNRFLFLVSPYFLFFFCAERLDWAGHFVSFWVHVNISYRIVSYRIVSFNGSRR